MKTFFRLFILFSLAFYPALYADDALKVPAEEKRISAPEKIQSEKKEEKKEDKSPAKGKKAVSGKKQPAQIGKTSPKKEPSRIKKEDKEKSPEEMLAEGNERFVKGKTKTYNISAKTRGELAKGQAPYAVIVTCSDSRVGPEIIFDETLGRLFVVRTAGNVVDPVALGSIEYAVEHLHVGLVVVLGHESCGAVKAAVDHKDDGHSHGNIDFLVKKILPAVSRARDITSKEKDLMDNSIRENVKNVVSEIVSSSGVVRELMDHGKLRIAGAYYSIADGRVTIIGKVPDNDFDRNYIDLIFKKILKW